MENLDAEIEAIVEMIRAVGGTASVDPNAPDFVKRAFLEMVRNCPDCRAMLKAAK